MCTNSFRIYNTQNLNTSQRIHKIGKKINHFETQRLGRVKDVLSFIKRKHEIDIHSFKDLTADIKDEFMNFDIGDPIVDNVTVDLEDENDDFFEQ